MTLSAATVPVPGTYAGYGTGLAVIGESPGVLLSWIQGEASFRCGALNTRSGSLSSGVPLRGEVRDAVFDHPDVGWVLSSYALSRVEVRDLEPRVLSTGRPTGLGTYQNVLLAAGADHLVAGSWSRTTTALIDRSSGALVRRVRLQHPECVELLDDVARIYAPRSGRFIDLDATDLTPRRSGSMPTGATPFIVRDELILVEGDRILAEDGTRVWDFWAIASDRIVVRDAHSLQEIRSAPLPEVTRIRLLGVEHGGRLVLAGESAITLLDPQSLGVVDRIDLSEHLPGLGPAVFVPATNVVVAMPWRGPRDRLAIVEIDAG